MENPLCRLTLLHQFINNNGRNATPKITPRFVPQLRRTTLLKTTLHPTLAYSMMRIPYPTPQRPFHHNIQPQTISIPSNILTTSPNPTPTN